MATVQKEIVIARDGSYVWNAVRDVGAIHRRLVPGFVVECRLEGDSRIITFANGMVVREIIVTVDDGACRHAWSARGEPFTHHNASIQVFTEGAAKCRVVWISDLLPNELSDTVDKMMSQGLGVMKRTLEGGPARA
jgi:Polyketide cyclase / dehydrase and lipid transport